MTGVNIDASHENPIFTVKETWEVTAGNSSRVTLDTTVCEVLAKDASAVYKVNYPVAVLRVIQGSSIEIKL